MDIATLITSLPSWVLFLLTTIIGVLGAEVGVWLVQRKAQKGAKDKEASTGSLVGALLGLLAFMLGFTFSITSSRFADRKELVVEQAKALGTCYLRTSYLPQKQKVESRRILQQYVDILAKMNNSTDVNRDVPKLEAMHLQLWNQAASLSQENMDSELRSLYISIVNDVIDIFGERKTIVLVFRIPGVLWTALLLLYVLSMFVVGYEIGTYSKRRVLDTPLMSAAFALIIVLIANMDSTRSKQRFQVSQQPIIEVQQLIHQQQVP